jgi:vacuolar-type H+-ATPase subunit E/Vma4
MSEPNIWEKINRFRQSVMQEADTRSQAILQDIKTYHDTELGRYKDDAQLDFGLLLDREQRKITAGLARKLALKRRELKGRFYGARETRRLSLFEQARAQLSDFTQQPEYGVFLQKKAAKAAALAQGARLRILLRHQDMGWKDALEQSCPCVVEETKRIRLGGLWAETGTGALMDETLDSALEERKDWFCAASGLDRIHA